MECIIKNLFEKISSYDLFNNLFPGIIFYIILEHTIKFSFSVEGVLEKLFLYYFIGIVINRIGAIVIEKFLKERNFIEYAPYNDYINASKKEPLIKVLSEKNSIYLTIVAMSIVIISVELYDLILGYISNNYWFSDLILLIIFLAIAILFTISYRKQTNYIKERIKEANQNSNS